jgi:hypothetical protein
MKAVSILCFGAQVDPWVFAMLDELCPNWCENSWDAALSLSDPLEGDRVKHTDNGSSAKTIVAVMGQPAFVDTVSAITSHVFGTRGVDAGILVPIYCKKGQHRSDVCSRFVTHALNSLHNDGGERLFNMQLFVLNESSCLRDKQHTVRQAVKWATDPWDAPMMPRTEHPFGMMECRARENASKNCAEAWQLIATLQDEFFASPQPFADATVEQQVNILSDDNDNVEPTVKLAPKSRPSKRTHEASLHKKSNRYSNQRAINIDRRLSLQISKFRSPQFLHRIIIGTKTMI